MEDEIKHSFEYISSKNDFLRLFTWIRIKAHLPMKTKMTDLND